MSLAAALDHIEKNFGAGAIQRLGDEAKQRVDVISTGSIALDKALGVGGLPRGRIVELYGPEASGKSTLALHLVANAQKVGTVAYIDTEYAIDPNYAHALGVDLDNLLLSQPDNAERAFEIIESLVDSGEISLIVLDSVAALVTSRELQGDYGDANVGGIARLMGQACRRLTGRVERNNTLLLAINQLRMKVGVVYGSPETTTGGRALPYYASVRLDCRRIQTETAGTEAVGNRTRVKVVKNRLAPPLRLAEFSIDFGKGISRHGELIDLGVQHGLVKKSGAWLKYADRQWQGRANAILALAADVDMAAALEGEIRAIG